MRGTVLKLKSQQNSYCHNSDPDDLQSKIEPDSPSRNESVSYMEQSCDASQISSNASYPNERKRAWMSSLDLNFIPSSLNSSPWKSDPTRNVPSSSCHQPVISWNGPAMWKAMAEHPLFPQYMELQAKLLELFETIQSDCKKDACEKALTALFMDKSPPTKSSSRSNGQSRPKDSLNTMDAQLAGQLSGNEENKEKIRSTSRPVRSLRMRQNSPYVPFFHTRPRKWECPRCSRVFAGSKWFEKHQVVCNAKPHQYKCKNCPKVFTRCKWLKRHEALCSVSKDSDCSPVAPATPNTASPQCKSEVLPEKFPSPSLKRGRLGLRCSSFTLYSKDSTSKANGTSSSNPKFAPLELSEDYSVEPDLPRHSETKTDEKQAAQNSSGSKVCVGHVGKSSKKKKLLCKGCLKVFKSKKSFLHHNKCSERQFMSEDLPHQCHECSLCFRSRNKLLRHEVFCCPNSDNKMMKHLKCPDCSKLFPDRKKQIKHKAVCCPDGETKSKVCSKCSVVILDKERMIAHQIVCDGSK